MTIHHHKDRLTFNTYLSKNVDAVKLQGAELPYPPFGGWREPDQAGRMDLKNLFYMAQKGINRSAFKRS